MDYRVRILREQMARRGIKQVHLATALGVSEQLISSWLSTPPRNKVTNTHWRALSEIWDLDLFEAERELELADAPRRPGSPPGLRAELPIINAAPGGVAIDYEEPYALPEDPESIRDVYETFPRPYNSSHPLAFCVRVVGESMVPELVPGDIVVCEPITCKNDMQERQLVSRTVFVRYGQAAAEGEDQDVPSEYAGKCCLAQWGGGNKKIVTLKKVNPKFEPRKVNRAWIARLAVGVYRGSKL